MPRFWNGPSVPVPVCQDTVLNDCISWSHRLFCPGQREGAQMTQAVVSIRMPSTLWGLCLCSHLRTHRPHYSTPPISESNCLNHRLNYFQLLSVLTAARVSLSVVPLFADFQSLQKASLLAERTVWVSAPCRASYWSQQSQNSELNPMPCSLGPCAFWTCARWARRKSSRPSAGTLLESGACSTCKTQSLGWTFHGSSWPYLFQELYHRYRRWTN